MPNVAYICFSFIFIEYNCNSLIIDLLILVVLRSSQEYHKLSGNFIVTFEWSPCLSCNSITCVQNCMFS